MANSGQAGGCCASIWQTEKCLSQYFTAPPYGRAVKGVALNEVRRVLPERWRVFAGLSAPAVAPRAPVVDVGRASFDYLPVLDGFRAVSILLVVFSHADLGNIVPGGLGVTVFFVISGFLITRQMIAEIVSTGGFSFGAFYLRRFFRLAPALLLYLAMFTSLFLLLGAHMTGWQIASGIFYVANYYHIFIGYPPLNPNPIQIGRASCRERV